MKKFLKCFLILLSAAVFGQQRAFLYEMRYRTNPERKDSMKTEKMELDVVGAKSVFRKEISKNYDSIYVKTGNMRSLEMGFENQFYVVKDLKTNTVEKIIQNFRDNFSINIDEKLIWKISSEKMKIGDFDCQKATAKYGGRNWTAWFAPAIPLQEGPYVFHGLPGLIVKINDEENDYNFILMQIKKYGDDLFFTRKPIKINWQNYRRLASEYYADPYQKMKPNSVGMGADVKVKYTDEHGNEITPNYSEWTKREQETIKKNNNPIELDQKIDYK